MHTRRGFKLIEVLAALCVVGMIFAVGMPQYIRYKERAKEAETKVGLHSIQLAVERFAVDTEGAYPQYLIGGENRQQPSAVPPRGASVAQMQASADPLIRRGYMVNYPANPFMRGKGGGGGDVLALQGKLSSSTVYGNDPLRPGTLEASAHGTRFGQQGELMGSVLADPRFREWTHVSGMPRTRPVSLPTFADVEYDFWDTWAKRPVKRWLPGEFFYKGMGPIVAVGGPDVKSDNDLILPTEIDGYIMGAYGGIRTAGKDVLGPEPRFQYRTKESNLAGSKSLWMWSMTRSEVGGPNDIQGSPFSLWKGEGNIEEMQFGNANGVRDGLIVIETTGAHWAQPR